MHRAHGKQNNVFDQLVSESLRNQQTISALNQLSNEDITISQAGNNTMNGTGTNGGGNKVLISFDKSTRSGDNSRFNSLYMSSQKLDSGKQH
jgi:hypothetical protein